MGELGRVAFLASGAFAVPLLEAIAPLTSEMLVVSAPDRPAGRGLGGRAAPVATRARELGLALTTPARLRSGDARAALDAFRPDGLLVADYGQLVPDALLAMARRPPLNVHPSLLPRHRGAGPISGAILAGDTETGVTLMIVIAELDAGPIVAQWRLALSGRETAPELAASLARLAAERVPGELERWAAGELPATPQDDARATYTRPLRREDGRIDWAASAEEIDRQARALQPWPGAWTTLDGRRIHIRRGHPSTEGLDAPPGSIRLLRTPAEGRQARVACGTGSLALEMVQPEGRAPMPADAWLRGVRSGSRLGT
jgi:methionyl-tRNA formyltransferase